MNPTASAIVRTRDSRRRHRGARFGWASTILPRSNSSPSAGRTSSTFIQCSQSKSLMRSCPNLRVQPYRHPDPVTGLVYSPDIDGWYEIPYRGVRLQVIASDGCEWVHVSVSLPHRCPTWEEMEFVRSLFFRDDETVMQLSVPRREHINCHRFCLHLWRPQRVEIPKPPAILVGPHAPRAVATP